MLIRISLCMTLGFGLLALTDCSKDDNGKGAQRPATLTRVTTLEDETLGGFAVGTQTEAQLDSLTPQPVEPN